MSAHSGCRYQGCEEYWAGTEEEFQMIFLRTARIEVQGKGIDRDLCS